MSSFFSIILNAQDDLKNIQFTSLGSPDSLDFNTLKSALKDVNIILLGEQTHYDGTTLKIKIELIKYLHESLGFDILAFESGMYSMDKANREIHDAPRSAKDVISFANFPSSLIGIYLKSKQFNDLLSYLDESKDLQIAGFDCQITGNYALEYLVPELREFINDHNYEYLAKDDYYKLEEVISELMNGDFKSFNSNSSDSARFQQISHKLTTRVSSLSSSKPDRAHFWLQLLESINACLNYISQEEKGVKYTLQNPRDLQMAKNLISLSERYPNKKIIAWGASYHFANQLTAIDFENDLTNKYLTKISLSQKADPEDIPSFSELLDGAIPMGKILKDKFKNRLYSLAFTSYQGNYGIENDSSLLFQILPPPEKSIEAALTKKDVDYAFVDYRNNDLPQFFYSSPLGYLPVRARWEQIYDGMVFIKEMQPLTLQNHQHAQSAEPDIEAPDSRFKIKGKVIDGKTNKPVPFAHIKISNTNYGTTTNIQGDFEITNVKNDIIISSIGYETVTVHKSTLYDGIKVKMPPATHVLNEVVVKAPLTEEVIIKKAYEHIQSNYIQQPYNLDIFYRNLEKRDSAILILEEAALNFYDSDGYERETWSKIVDHKFLKVTQLRKSINSKKGDKTSLSQVWTIWTTDPILTPDNIFSPGRLQNYEIELTDIRQYANQDVYELKFRCIKPNSYSTPYAFPSPSKYEGSILINAENFAVIKYEAFTTWEQSYHKKKRLIKAFELNEPFYLTKSAHDLYYYDRYENKYTLRYAKRKFSYHVKPESSVNSIIQFNETEVVTTGAEFKNPKPIDQSLLEIDTNVPYDKEFWNSFNIKISDYTHE